MSTPLLALESVTKSFPGVLALDQVSLSVMPGEVHALVGENGAGKSTLIKIITGAHAPDAGVVRWQGEPVRLRSPWEALQRGIAAIYQEPHLCPDLTVLENLFLGRQPTRRGLFLDRQAMRLQAGAVAASLGLTLNLSAPVRELSPAQWQQVEICKALLHDVRLLIMDEPTSSLTEHDVRRLFAVVRRLRTQGVGILYISHRLEEIFDLADRVTVLRDGRHVSTKPVHEATPDALITDMVGRKLDQLFPRTEHEPGDVALAVRNLCRAGNFDSVSFDVRSGEILGFAGLVGAGRTEIAQALFGIAIADTGTVTVHGRQTAIRSPDDAIRHGIAYVPEDRQKQGLALGMTVRENMSLSILHSLARAGFIRGTEERRLATEQVRSLGVKTATIESPAATLSGGNQQKVVLGKWLASQPQVLILDEPTRGVDVGAKAEIYRLMDQLARQGLAIMLISSELPELLGMSNRILAVRGGRIAGEFSRAEATQEAVLRACLGASDVQRAAATEGEG